MNRILLSRMLLNRKLWGMLLSLSVMNVYAIPSRSCGVDRITENNMRLANYSGSQSGTSIFVNCNNSYNIKFQSQNLRSSQGDSFLQNAAYPNYRVSTRMSINGDGIPNKWGQNISGPTGEHVKYTIAVQVNDNLNRNLPAGQYEDKVWVNISF